MDVIAEAGDIPEAEAQARTLHPDLAVVDVMLPGVNGLEGAYRLKALVPELRVILVSAHQDQAHIFRQAAERAGAEAFVQKDDLALFVVSAWLSDGEALEDRSGREVVASDRDVRDDH
jgi:DNA-binding NarL/FixJ family response regulator